MQLSRDFREFIACLNAHDVRFLIVGGYAVAAHGHPRLTKDLEVWILADPANAERVVAALDDFGFAGIGVDPSDLSAPGKMLQLGRPPQRIDILTSIDGVAFNDCYQRRLEFPIGGSPVPFIGLDELISSKLATGRHQDLADVEALQVGIDDGED
jgi:hypothetical protein